MGTEARTGKMPKQISYIVGNEAAERFSFYGMRSILVIFMTQYLFLKEHKAKEVFHLFAFANYFIPVFGAILADRFLGRYKTILYLSLFYCVGHGILALFESEIGLYTGLFFIAVGSGGIKPCVSALVGDQFDRSNEHLLDKVYSIFYFSINFGSFFSTLLIPWTLKAYGPGVAFGIPGILMGVATLIFWLGRKEYMVAPHSGHGSQFLSVIWYAVTHQKDRRPGQRFLEVAEQKFSKEKVKGIQAVLSIFAVFAATTGFWALYDQHGASWVLQAKRMDRDFWGVHLESSMIPAVNPILVMTLLPLFSFGVYPWIEKLGIKTTPLRKMGVGMLLIALSFFWVGFLQSRIDLGERLNIIWQLGPWVILTAAEVMVSVTGLSFAYTQAPKEMKSTIMSLWLMTTAFGNLLTAVVSRLNPFQSGAMEFYFYAVLMLAVALVFAFMASRYQDKDYLGAES
jgi:POT family proton-dependent oligopeptide transporter